MYLAVPVTAYAGRMQPDEQYTRGEKKRRVKIGGAASIKQFVQPPGIKAQARMGF
jgi:hypothetical protein